jgi:hypothetical protein
MINTHFGLILSLNLNQILTDEEMIYSENKSWIIKHFRPSGKKAMS